MRLRTAAVTSVIAIVLALSWPSAAAAAGPTDTTTAVVVAESALAAGETSLVTFTFDEPVSGFDVTDLTIANGTMPSVTSGDGGITWTGTLTPTPNITDTSNVVTVDLAGISDAASAPGSGVATSSNYAIDTLRPTAWIVVADTSLAVGQTSVVTFSFSEAVIGFDVTDLTIANGTMPSVTSSDGGITWTGTLTPTPNITDTSNIITLDNTGITDAAGNSGTGTIDSNNYGIDTLPPTASIVISDTALAAGETSTVTFAFSEAVTNFTNADPTIGNGTLSLLSSTDLGITWTATFTPTDDVTASSNIITLDNTGFTDVAGNVGTGITDSNNYAIDTLRPTASIVVSDTVLAADETSTVTFTFSEAVSNFDNSDLSMGNGTLSSPISTDGGITWTATFTPTDDVTASSNIITLDNTGITDVAGNSGTGTTDSNNYAIDTLRPTVIIVVSDTALAEGESALVTFTFSEAVTGFANADVAVPNGTLSTVATGDGGTTWTATYTPTPNVSVAANVITVSLSGVESAAGNAGVGVASSNTFAVNTAAVLAGLPVTGADIAWVVLLGGLLLLSGLATSLIAHRRLRPASGGQRNN